MKDPIDIMNQAIEDADLEGFKYGFTRAPKDYIKR
jgi:hypothetical protein